MKTAIVASYCVVCGCIIDRLCSGHVYMCMNDSVRLRFDDMNYSMTCIMVRSCDHIQVSQWLDHVTSCDLIQGNG